MWPSCPNRKAGDGTASLSGKIHHINPFISPSGGEQHLKTLLEETLRACGIVCDRVARRTQRSQTTLFR